MNKEKIIEIIENFSTEKAVEFVGLQVKAWSMIYIA